MFIKDPIDLLNGIETNYIDLKCKDNIGYINLKNKLSNPNVFTKFNTYDDDLFLHALRIYSNLNTLILFNKDKKSAFIDFYQKKYKNEYILYGIKEISLSKNSVIKALYQLLYYRHQTKHIQDYLKYLDSYTEYYRDFTKLSDNDNIKISVLILSSRKSNINFYNICEEANNDYLLYVPNNDEEQWICSTLFFNQNSLDFLEKQDLKFYLKSDNKECWEKMNNFLRFVNSVIPIKERHRTMFYSSTLLYFLGHRGNNDFDYMVFCKENDDTFHSTLREFEISENVPYVEKNGKGIYDFSYINTQDKRLKRGYYEDYYDVWAQTYGQTHSASVRKWEEIYAFGKNHMYYLGVKSTLLSQDIIRRQMRNRPRGIADLISLRKRYGMKINIPKPPKTIEKFYKVNELSLERKSELLGKGGVISNAYGFEELKVEEPVNQDKFVDTIIWALKTRYNMEFTISEIFIELGIERSDSVKNTFKIRIAQRSEQKEKKQVIKTKDVITGEITKINVNKSDKSKVDLKDVKDVKEVKEIKIRISKKNS